MEKILISKCLLGEKVNYLGDHAHFEHSILQKWAAEGRLVSVCPEVQGGAPIPRPPAEIIGKGGGEAVLSRRVYVKTQHGIDMTDIFLKGAETALRIAKQHDIKIAILKARSPSCGNDKIYDGNFTGNKIPGAGVTTALLRQNNIMVFNEEQLDEAERYLHSIEPGTETIKPNLITEPNLLGILDKLKKREPIFHHPEYGTSCADFEKMTDTNFWEVGASGRRYSREYVINILVERYNNSHNEDVWETKDFHCLEIAKDNYLLTYTLIQGKRITRRSTIWRFTQDGWKIVYHQGTLVQN